MTGRLDFMSEMKPYKSIIQMGDKRRLESVGIGRVLLITKNELGNTFDIVGDRGRSVSSSARAVVYAHSQSINVTLVGNNIKSQTSNSDSSHTMGLTHNSRSSVI